MQISPPIVLVVDDNEQKRYSVTRYLKSAGYTVWEAATGLDALKLAENMPGVITLDVNLPDMQGYEVCRRLRANPKTSGIPLIHVSCTFTGADHKSKGLENGADSYLTGPVEPEELIATVGAMLRMRKAEVTSRTLAAQWQVTFDAITDAVVLVSSDGHVERCNTAFIKLLDCPPGMVVGRRLSEVASGSATIDQSVYFRMARSRRRETIERQCNNRWYSITAHPVLEADGAFRGGVLILSDVTDRKHIEQAMQREQDALVQETAFLEEIVAERGRQLEESARHLEGFCRAMAHKLGAPATDVRQSMNELTARCSPHLGTVGKAMAARIVTAAAAIEQVTRELLAFDDLGNPAGSFEKVDLKAAVEAAWAQLAPAHKNATLTIQRPLSKAWGNRALAERIAFSFLSNALKFVAPGEIPAITISTEKRGASVRLWFEDNGVGIEPARRERVFNLLEPALSRGDLGGSGLGLALARRAAGQMRGSVGIEPGLTRGSRFWLELPVRAEP